MTRERTRRRRRLGPVLAVAILVVAAIAVWRGPDVVLRFQHPLDHQATIAQAAAAERIDPYLIAAVINVESGFRETVVSSAGAVGLMQVRPSTAKAVARRIGVTGKMSVDALSEPDTNIRVGTAYLGELIARYGGNVDLALAAYNAGITNADAWAARWKPSAGALSATIDFPETARYVDQVLAQRDLYRRLYPTDFDDAGK